MQRPYLLVRTPLCNVPKAVGGYSSTGIDGQADRISQIYTGV